MTVLHSQELKALAHTRCLRVADSKSTSKHKLPSPGGMSSPVDKSSFMCDILD